MKILISTPLFLKWYYQEVRQCWRRGRCYFHWQWNNWCNSQIDPRTAAERKDHQTIGEHCRNLTTHNITATDQCASTGAWLYIKTNSLESKDSLVKKSAGSHTREVLELKAFQGFVWEQNPKHLTGVIIAYNYCGNIFYICGLLTGCFCRTFWASFQHLTLERNGSEGNPFLIYTTRVIYNKFLLSG